MLSGGIGYRAGAALRRGGFAGAGCIGGSSAGIQAAAYAGIDRVFAQPTLVAARARFRRLAGGDVENSLKIRRPCLAPTQRSRNSSRVFSPRWLACSIAATRPARLNRRQPDAPDRRQ